MADESWNQADQNAGGLVERTIRGSFQGATASGITVLLGLLRAVLLARLLLPEHFGLAALALFFASMPTKLTELGLDTTLLHRHGESNAFRCTYLTARMVLAAVKTVVLLAAIPILRWLYPDLPQFDQLLAACAVLFLFIPLSDIQRTLLRKKLAFGSLAKADIAAACVMTIVAPWMAWKGYGVWAIFGQAASETLTRLVLTRHAWKGWKPRLAYDAEAGALMWRLGKAQWVRTNLGNALDTFDDFWLGTSLGQVALGFYSKAYEFAQSPRRVFCWPLMLVFGPVFASLQSDRASLSHAFRNSTYVLTRTVFFGSGLFALLMPEFIEVVIGEKWRPMLWTFRWLLVYAAVDSLLLFSSELLGVVGKANALRNAAIIQTIFFIPAVIAGAALVGTNGVAIAANIMLLDGLVCLLRPLRQTVDFSVLRLLGWPLVALVCAFGAGLWIELATGAALWQAALAKLTVFCLIFAGLLLAVERGQLLSGAQLIWRALRKRAQ